MIKVSVNQITEYDITFYTKAGDTITNGDEYKIEYSTDTVNWTFLAGPLSSTNCTELSTVALPSPFYVRVRRDIQDDPVEVAAEMALNTECLGNNNDLCGDYLTYLPTGNAYVKITVYVNNGAMSNC